MKRSEANAALEKAALDVLETVGPWTNEPPNGVFERLRRAVIVNQINPIADKVLRYRPKPKSKPARRRKRRKAKLDKSK